MNEEAAKKNNVFKYIWRNRPKFISPSNIINGIIAAIIIIFANKIRENFWQRLILGIIVFSILYLK